MTARRRARLVCTLGPATAERRVVRDLIEAGTDVFRVNLSHGDAEDHAALVETVREAGAASGTEPAVMADLPGPKIRLGEVAGGSVRLDSGSAFSLRPDDSLGDESGASTTYPELGRDVRVGDRILLADGAVELCVRDVGAVVTTEVVRAGSVRSRAGVNVPAERLSLPAITERDREALTRALDLGVDLIAQSFVRRAADVSDLRSLMRGHVPGVVAKIETRPALEDIDAILVQADAIMVARGDLGVELPLEEIPVLQKELLRTAHAAGRPSIVATQMLESMTRAPRPTRAEASDVANAVLDGADAIMLSAETAIGEYPVEAAAAAARIATVAEDRAAAFRASRPALGHADEAAAVAHAAAQIAADDVAVVAISCYTQTGRTAASLSVERPAVPIFAFAPDPSVRRALNLRWGVRSLPAERPPDTDAMIALMADSLRASGAVERGDSVVMVASMPVGKSHTNMLKIHRIGAPVR